MAREGVCRGCGLGWSRECDALDDPLMPCGCGATHGHDPMVKSTCDVLVRRVKDNQG